MVLASPAGSAATHLVRVGVAPRLPANSRVLGAPAASTLLHVTVALMPRRPAALSAYAHAASTPGSSSYRQYLTTPQFAARFGATRAQIAAVDAALRARGLRPGAVSANALSIPVTASAGVLSRALAVSLKRLSLPGRRTAIVADAAPALDAHVAPLVQGVLGLDNASAPAPQLRRGQLRAGASRAHARPRVNTGGPQPCSAATAAAPDQNAYTADQLASAYGFTGLYGAGDQGQGQTIALYELEPYSPSDIAAFQQCYGTRASVTNVNIDGGAGSGAGSGEAALDIETAISLAPRASMLVYEAPNSDSNAPGAGPYDAFAAIISQDRAKVVSASWGQCETLEGSTDADAEATLFQEAAVQGQTIVSAAGDDGSEDCYTGQATDLHPALAVDDPASQQFVTGVGGTNLSTIGPRPNESVWNSNAGGNVITAQLASGAGGGGRSALWRMPPYQTTAASSLHVRAQASGSVCGAGSGFCREVPDVTADGDPATGYLIYFNGDGQEAGQPAGWQGIGGTSGGAPLWGALIALGNDARACAGSPLGFINPALYRAAASAYSADFNDVRTGSNDFTETNGSNFSAGTAYDMASGLGSPNGAALIGTMCSERLQIVNPGTRSSTVHAPVSLKIKASNISGSTPHYVARGLPPGLSINSSTGKITGRPRKLGSSAVSVFVSDADDAVASISFTWTIGGSPTLSESSLTGVGFGLPHFQFTVGSGHRAPELSGVAISPPPNMRFSKTPHRVTVTVPGGGRRRFTATVHNGILTVLLPAVVRRFTFKIRYSALVNNRKLIGEVRSHTVGRLKFGIVTIDALGGTTRLALRLKPRS
jgi:subtilase family serine protease